MKTKMHYLGLAVFFGIMCVAAPGEVELPGHLEQPWLLGGRDPTLAGIEKLYAVIVPPDSEPSKGGLAWEELQAKVEFELEGAGIQIVRTYSGADELEIPHFQIDVDMLRLEDSQQYVFHIQASLAAKVSLTVQPLRYMKADVWKLRPVMQVTSAKNMPAAVTAVVMEQAEAFIRAHRVANPPDVQALGSKGLSNAAAGIEQDKPTAKQSAAEYKYVASKNSEVFHKPECRWAKKISAGNLVSYSSRNEAVEAGKRPCKWCKP